MKSSLLPIFVLTLAVTSLAQTANPTMKAIVVHEYGGPEVLKYEDVPRPEPKEDQILVRVIAAGVNPVDDASRSEKYAKFFGITLPFIPGYDIAGVVEKTGSKIAKFKPGDSVYAYLSLKDGGGYAEYAVVTEAEAAPKPKSLNYESAAAVPVVALTAWQALIDNAKLSVGPTVLIHGGSGGGGNFCDPNRQGARGESDRDGIDGESGFPETARCGCGHRLYEAKVRGRCEGCRRCAGFSRERHAQTFLWRG